MIQFREQILEVNFDNWFDQAMRYALQENYEQPTISAEQIENSWQVVRKRMEFEISKQADEV